MRDAGLSIKAWMDINDNDYEKVTCSLCSTVWWLYFLSARMLLMVTSSGLGLSSTKPTPTATWGSSPSSLLKTRSPMAVVGAGAFVNWSHLHQGNRNSQTNYLWWNGEIKNMLKMLIVMLYCKNIHPPLFNNTFFYIFWQNLHRGYNLYRPQTDGPALRAMALSKWGNILIGATIK